MLDCLGVRHDGGVENCLIFDFTGRLVRLFDDAVDRRALRPAWLLPSFAKAFSSLSICFWVSSCAQGSSILQLEVTVELQVPTLPAEILTGSGRDVILQPPAAGIANTDPPSFVAGDI